MIRQTSDGRPICQACSDPVDPADHRIRTPAGILHRDCADQQRERAA